MLHDNNLGLNWHTYIMQSFLYFNAFKECPIRFVLCVFLSLATGKLVIWRHEVVATSRTVLFRLMKKMKKMEKKCQKYVKNDINKNTMLSQTSWMVMESDAFFMPSIHVFIIGRMFCSICALVLITDWICSILFSSRSCNDWNIRTQF